jgi:hypothetical protein
MISKANLKEWSIVEVYPQNRHYYMYKGEPVLLITSAEHYGAVINMDFDYIAYFNMLKKYELNYTRIYPGAYIEIEGMFIEENTLAPELGKLIVPWARSEEPGCFDGGNKFNLEKWDEKYFSRLRDFVEKAAERDIVVEICFFNCQYPEGWVGCPLNSINNIQGIGNINFVDFQIIKHKDLLNVQEKYISKIVEEVNEFGNVIFELCDESTLHHTPVELALEWIIRLVDVIIETEMKLPNKHLIAQQREGGVDLTKDPRVSVIVGQYICQNECLQFGGIETLDCSYDCNKPIELNETGYYPIWYVGDKIAASRVEAWEFIIGGGAGFNQLNGIYTVKNPKGDSPDNHKLLESLMKLRHFMYGFEFYKMYQDKDFIKGGIPRGANVRSISEPGKQYALYIHHGVLKEGNHLYIVTPGKYSANLQIDIPAGSYESNWICPETGSSINRSTFVHAGGIRVLQSPNYEIDIALTIKAI